MTIRTVIVDDEKPARDRIKRFLAEHPDFEVVGEAGDGTTAVATINAARPDLVFLDVQMPEADGFDVLEQLEVLPHIVFATAFDRYAVQAFEVHSVDYLLKPFDRKRFAAALGRVREEIRKRLPAEEKLDALLEEIRESARALRRAAGSAELSPQPGGPPEGGAGAGEADREHPASSAAGSSAPTHQNRAPEDEAVMGGARLLTPGDRISGKRGPRIYLLAPAEILWFEADGELVFARSASHRYLVSRTLTDLEATLDPKAFFRSHRSFIVNLSAIGEIVPEDSGNYRIIMRDKERTAVPLSRRQARRLRDVFPW